ncbi:hypothetical protein FOFC_00586 [Fusarium oxysporum]|nr:hypothetical protein FOFC_00586 [Fusarium oxysporum]
MLKGGGGELRGKLSLAGPPSDAAFSWQPNKRSPCSP